MPVTLPWLEFFCGGECDYAGAGADVEQVFARVAVELFKI